MSSASIKTHTRPPQTKEHPSRPKAPSDSWIYWEAGFLSALAALTTTPSHEPSYLLLGMICLLFFWGLIRN